LLSMGAQRSFSFLCFFFFFASDLRLAFLCFFFFFAEPDDEEEDESEEEPESEPELSSSSCTNADSRTGPLFCERKTAAHPPSAIGHTTRVGRVVCYIVLADLLLLAFLAFLPLLTLAALAFFRFPAQRNCSAGGIGTPPMQRRSTHLWFVPRFSSRARSLSSCALCSSRHFSSRFALSVSTFTLAFSRALKTSQVSRSTPAASCIILNRAASYSTLCPMGFLFSGAQSSSSPIYGSPRKPTLRLGQPRAPDAERCSLLLSSQPNYSRDAAATGTLDRQAGPTVGAYATVSIRSHSAQPRH
jgi:hypothetical protein